MHIILATMGTDGDVIPYLGLAHEFVQNGHRVTLAAPETYHTKATACGFEFSSLVTVDEVERMLSEPDLWHPLRSGLFMTRWGGPLIPRQYESCMGKRSDVSQCDSLNGGDFFQGYLLNQVLDVNSL